MTREDDRYNAAFLAHDEITDYFQPYAEFFYMDDKTHQQIAPAALFKDSNPLDPFGTTDVLRSIAIIRCVERSATGGAPFCAPPRRSLTPPPIRVRRASTTPPRPAP